MNSQQENNESMRNLTADVREWFLEKIQIGYLNAILDKISKEIRKDD